MIKDLVKKELARQKKAINLIASENYPSKNVLAALASQLSSKYAEGRSHQRYYFGNKFIDEIEDEVIRLARRVFRFSPKNYGVNVQPYSGSPANLAIYLGALKIGDRVLAMSLGHGGHLSHGHNISFTGKLFKFEHYGVGKDGFLDYGGILKIAKGFKPKMVVCGATAYPRKIDFKKFRQIADSVPSTSSGRGGALLMADISHIAGLIAGRVHPPPFPYADIVMTTTQKTLRGPRGAIIISRNDLFEAIDKAVFPGLQGGPHLNVIAAIGVALEEALKPDFKKYAKQVIKNAKVLAKELGKNGFKIISGGTDNHIVLVDVSPLGLTGKQAGEKLEKEGIIVNKNMIPFDPRKPWDPSGIRLGTPAETTKGAKEKDMIKIAKQIAEILKN